MGIKFKLKTIAIMTFIVVIILFHSSCTKDSGNNNSNSINDNSLSSEDNALIEAASIPNPPLDSLLDASGQPFIAKKSIHQITTILDDIKNEMIKKGQELCNLKTTELHVGEGDNKPEHMGIAYSFGSKLYNQRQQPPSGNSIHVKDAVFGLDCSGFIYVLLTEAANIPVIHSKGNEFIVYSLEKKIKEALLRSPFPQVKIINKSAGLMSISEFKVGDIILWKKNPEKRHVGIIAKKIDNKYIVFQSNGTGFPIADSVNHLPRSAEENQKRNYNYESRGVHPFDLEKMLRNVYWGTDFEILRFEVDDPYIQLLSNGSSKTWRVQVFTANGNGDALLGNVIKYTFKSDYTYTKTINGNSAAGGTFGFDYTNNKFYINAETNIYDFTLTDNSFIIDKTSPQSHMEMIPQ